MNSYLKLIALCLLIAAFEAVVELGIFRLCLLLFGGEE